MKKYLLLLLAAGTLLLLAGCQKTINLNDYLSVSFSGYDTDGKAAFVIDEEKMLMDNSKTFKMNGENQSLALRSYYKTQYQMGGELDDTVNLSNGDKVKFYWENDLSALEEKYKVKFTYSDQTFIVEGLKKAKEYNPFDDVTVSFDGYDTIGSINCTYTGDIPGLVFFADTSTGLTNGQMVKVTYNYSYGDLKKAALEMGKIIVATEKEYTVSGLTELVDYDPFEDVSVIFDGKSASGSASISYNGKLDLYTTVDRSKDLKNGDVLSVKIDSFYNDIQKEAAKKGYRLVSTEKTYTVEGLAAYLDTLEDLPGDALSQMDRNANDYLRAYVAERWGENESFHKMELLGEYLLVAKNMSSVRDFHNMVYLVYKVYASNEESGDFEYYFYMRYNDILIIPDGSCSYNLSQYKVPEGNYFFGISGEAFTYGDHWYKGYLNLDSMFNQLVTTQIVDYTYESTVVDE